MSKTTTQPLSPDQLETQLNNLDLLLAMYPDPTEIEISPSDTSLISVLRDNPSHPTPPSIHLALSIPIDPTHNIQLNITIPLLTPTPNDPESPPITFTLRQPPWLEKSTLSKLSSHLPTDLFSALETLQEEATPYIPCTPTAPPSNPEASKPLCRVWFYFPSLSTREKRHHMVTWAPQHLLTGFVLAGKPGLLCLEGASADIDAYMNEIKTVSWSDIPSYQKKVSERYREMGVQRVFGGMQEITGVVGGMHGQRGNRGDMRALEAWLRDKGLGTAFESVILQSV